MRFYILLLLSLLSWGAFARDTASLSSDELSRAKELYAEAQALYKSKDYEKALTLYQEAYQISKEPGLILSIAQCQRHSGKAEDAIKNYRLYLEKEPESPYKDQIEPKIKKLEEQIVAAKSLAASQPSPAPTSAPSGVDISIASTETYSVYQSKEVNASFDEIEDLIKRSEEELAKIKKRLRLVLPGGIALAAGMMGTGAFLIHSTIEANNTINNQLQASHITLAVASDLAFLAAGYTLYRALSKNKKESSFEVGVAPTVGGASFAISFRK
jgi:tetratricopeptide (TPR) repeat protein